MATSNGKSLTCSSGERFVAAEFPTFRRGPAGKWTSNTIINFINKYLMCIHSINSSNFVRNFSEDKPSRFLHPSSQEESKAQDDNPETCESAPEQVNFCTTENQLRWEHSFCCKLSDISHTRTLTKVSVQVFRWQGVCSFGSFQAPKRSKTTYDRCVHPLALDLFC